MGRDSRVARQELWRRLDAPDAHGRQECLKGMSALSRVSLTSTFRYICFAVFLKCFGINPDASRMCHGRASYARSIEGGREEHLAGISCV